MSTPENDLRAELDEAKRELEKLRRDVALAAKIIGDHQSRAEDAAEKYPTSRDYYTGWASGYKMSLDALHQATNGQFGKAYVSKLDETPAATSLTPEQLAEVEHWSKTPFAHDQPPAATS